MNCFEKQHSPCLSGVIVACPDPSSPARTPSVSRRLDREVYGLGTDVANACVALANQEKMAELQGARGSVTALCHSLSQLSVTAILGSRIEPLAKQVVGLQICTLPAADYAEFHITNPKLIRSAWQHIWSHNDLVRSYSGDFE